MPPQQQRLATRPTSAALSPMNPARAPAAQHQAPATTVHHVLHPAAKELGITYVLLIFLGTVGAHRFYLGRTGTGITMLCLTLVGWFTSWWFGLGIPLLLVTGIWWFVDLFLSPGMVREANVRAISRFRATASRTSEWPARWE